MSTMRSGCRLGACCAGGLALAVCLGGCGSEGETGGAGAFGVGAHAGFGGAAPGGGGSTFTGSAGTGGYGADGGAAGASANGGTGGAAAAGGAGGGAACSFPPRDAAIMVYYGTFKDDDGTQRPDLTYQLYNPNLDSVFTVGGGSIFTQGAPSAPGDPGTGAFKDYHDHCLRIALHMGTHQVAACVRRTNQIIGGNGSTVDNPCADYHVAGGTGADDLAAYWQAMLDLGWDYIAIDEIKTISASLSDGSSILINFKNGGTESNRFASALGKLADVGYDKRVITFFVPHDADGPPPSLPEYTDFLRACRDHCRTTQVELYYTTTEIEGGSAANFDNYATALHNLGISNINRSFSAIIAVGNDLGVADDPDDDWWMLDHAPCDISPWTSSAYGELTCPAMPNSGGIHRQLQAMHQGDYTQYWWGVGFYKIGAVRSKTNYWTKTDFVQSLAARVDWWATHTQP